MDKDTKINIRLSEELKSDVKKYLDADFSKEIRKALRKAIENKKIFQKEWLSCFVCENTYYSLDDMMLLNVVDEFDDEFDVKGIICRECFNKLINIDPKTHFKLLREKKKHPTRLDREFLVYIDLEYCKKQRHIDKELGIDENWLQTLIRGNEKSVSLDIARLLLKFYPSDYKIFPGMFLTRKLHDKEEEIIDKRMEFVFKIWDKRHKDGL